MLKKLMATLVALSLILVPAMAMAYEDTMYHFKVVGSDGQLLDDVEMIIYDSDNEEYDSWNTSDSNPYDAEDIFDIGETYTVHQETEADGYTKAADQTFTVTAGEKTITLTNQKVEDTDPTEGGDEGGDTDPTGGDTDPTEGGDTDPTGGDTDPTEGGEEGGDTDPTQGGEDGGEEGGDTDPTGGDTDPTQGGDDETDGGEEGDDPVTGGDEDGEGNEDGDGTEDGTTDETDDTDDTEDDTDDTEDDTDDTEYDTDNDEDEDADEEDEDTEEDDEEDEDEVKENKYDPQTGDMISLAMNIVVLASLGMVFALKMRKN